MINVASFHTTPVEYRRALSSAAELVLSTHLLLTARQEALPWMGKDVARTQLIEQALEGGVSGLPAPTVASLKDVTKRLSDLDLQALREIAKWDAQCLARGTGRGFGRGGCAGRRGCGRFN